MLGQVFGNRKQTDPKVFRKARPLRNNHVTWEASEDGIIILKAPLQSHGRGLFSMLAKWAKSPAEKSFELEPVGAAVWLLCDGKHTCEGITKHLREEFKMNRLEAETALAAFLQMLAQRRLITLMIKEGS